MEKCFGCGISVLCRGTITLHEKSEACVTEKSPISSLPGTVDEKIDNVEYEREIEPSSRDVSADQPAQSVSAEEIVRETVEMIDEVEPFLCPYEFYSKIHNYFYSYNCFLCLLYYCN